MNWRNKRTKAVHAERTPQQMACGARKSGNMTPTLEPLTCENCIEARREGFKVTRVPISVYDAVHLLQEQGYPVTYDDSPSALRRLIREIDVHALGG